MIDLPYFKVALLYFVKLSLVVAVLLSFQFLGVAFFAIVCMENVGSG